MYTAQRVEYVGGTFFGNENQEATKTLLAFHVASLVGNYQDLVCFIPIISINSSLILSYTDVVLETLASVGLHVCLISVDGHQTNVRFFKELGQGSLEIRVPHPLDDRHHLFTIFDPVHLFKNFYHNFQKTR